MAQGGEITVFAPCGHATGILVTAALHFAVWPTPPFNGLRIRSGSTVIERETNALFRCVDHKVLSRWSQTPSRQYFARPALASLHSCCDLTSFRVDEIPIVKQHFLQSWRESLTERLCRPLTKSMGAEEYGRSEERGPAIFDMPSRAVSKRKMAEDRWPS
jgi:hypothetical protein